MFTFSCCLDGFGGSGKDGHRTPSGSLARLASSLQALLSIACWCWSKRQWSAISDLFEIFRLTSFQYTMLNMLCTSFDNKNGRMEDVFWGSWKFADQTKDTVTTDLSKRILEVLNSWRQSIRIGRSQGNSQNYETYIIYNINQSLCWPLGFLTMVQNIAITLGSAPHTIKLWWRTHVRPCRRSHVRFVKGSPSGGNVMNIWELKFQLKDSKGSPVNFYERKLTTNRCKHLTPRQDAGGTAGDLGLVHCPGPIGAHVSMASHETTWNDTNACCLLR